jgi:hypothetical protein
MVSAPSMIGYNTNHLRFSEQEARWQKKTTTKGSQSELVCLKVMFARVMVVGTKTKILPVQVYFLTYLKTPLV